MAITVDTKDTTALSDSELSDMADISSDYDAGFLSKARDEWVLITLASENGNLAGFSFCTLERIGGTPCVLIGVASVRQAPKRDAVLAAVVAEQLRRAVLAFPDEDVLVEVDEHRSVARVLGEETLEAVHEGLGQRTGRQLDAHGRGLL